MSETTTGGRADDGAPGPAEADLLEAAWGVIANAGWDDCAKTPGWQEAAVRWRDAYHEWLRVRGEPYVTATVEGLKVVLPHAFEAIQAEVRVCGCGKWPDHPVHATAADPGRLADVENALGQGVRMAQSWQEMRGTVTWAEAGRRVLDALGYGEAGPDWPLAFGALAELVRGEWGYEPLAETVRRFADIAGRDEKAVGAVRDAEAYWVARGAGWTQT